MKKINTYITEKLKIKKSSYNYFPKTKEELKDIINQLIEDRGNKGNFNDIDTSEITDMSDLFSGMEKFNGDISGWNVSNVKYMTYMFHLCKSFNCDISNWDVSNIKYNKEIFEKCILEEKHKPKFK